MCMAVLLLASTVSWTVGQHYCMGRLINVSLFVHAEDCGMDMAFETSSTDIKKSCCSDEILVIEGQEELKISFEDISLTEQQFLIAYTISFLKHIQNFEEQNNPLPHYLPPLLVKDIQVLDAVFLI